ncbi:MAG: helix-turn-helix transcriptional regulator [Thermoanaerobaculia bacterium]|nr:helix-turn-helix transcriptional regulator [Thermoanaerobaculia bacterium]
MSVPRLSNLQFLVLGALRAGPLTGGALRDQLREFGVRRSGPGFYQMMSRLEQAELVKGWYTQEIVEGQIIRQRHYELLPSGASAWRRQRDFQMSIIDRFDDVGQPA